MSEPNQLYVHVHLSRKRFDALIASKFPDVSSDPAVLEWLANASYYGPKYTAETVRERLSDYETVGQWVDAVTGPGVYGFPMPVRNHYDEAEQSWTLGVLDFSESYDDYLAAVAACRAISQFKDLPSEDGMLIYGYMFSGDAVSVALRIRVGEASFITEEEAAPLVAQANVTMKALVDEGAAAAGGAEEA